MDPSQWPSLAEWDPEFKKFHDEHLDAMVLPDAKTAEDVAQWRAQSAPLMKENIYGQLDFSGVEQTAVEIPFRDGTSLPSLVFKPTTPPAGGSPLAVLYHGGGFIVGSGEMEAPSAVSLVKDSGAVVVSVEYRLAPEHPFPTPVHDSWDALKWLGADPSKGFLIGGESAGGNISAVLQHLARDEGLRPALTGVWLGYPSTLSLSAELPEEIRSMHTSYEQNANAPILTKASMDQMGDFYQADPKSDLSTPQLWSSGHAGLTRTYIQVCGLDPLRDDGLLYDRALRAAGVETKLDVYAGMPHGYDLMFGQLPATQKMRAERAQAFKWLLGAAM